MTKSDDPREVTVISGRSVVYLETKGTLTLDHHKERRDVYVVADGKVALAGDHWIGNLVPPDPLLGKPEFRPGLATVEVAPRTSTVKINPAEAMKLARHDEAPTADEYLAARTVVDIAIDKVAAERIAKASEANLVRLAVGRIALGDIVVDGLEADAPLPKVVEVARRLVAEASKYDGTMPTLKMNRVAMFPDGRIEVAFTPSEKPFEAAHAAALETISSLRPGDTIQQPWGEAWTDWEVRAVLVEDELVVARRVYGDHWTYELARSAGFHVGLWRKKP